MGLFGSMMGGIVETPEQRRQREQLEAMFPEMVERDAPEMGIGIDTGGPAAKPQRAPGFFQGGEGFSGRDAIAGILAVIGDALAQRGGGQGGAVEGLMGQRQGAMKMAQDQAEEQARYQDSVNALTAAGYNPQQAAAMARGLLKPSDVKPERMMTKSGDIVAFGTDGSSTTAYRETAPDLLAVQGAGVYAMDRHTGQPFGGAGTGPAVGTIEDGHRFKGGNPSDPSSWEPVAMGGAGLRNAPRTFRR